MAEGRRSRGAHPVVRGSGVRFDTGAVTPAERLAAIVSEERPPPGHYEPGAVRLLGALP